MLYAPGPGINRDFEGSYCFPLLIFVPGGLITVETIYLPVAFNVLNEV